ncbi:NAD(P)-binding domain-containing protein [Corynebacterium sp. 4HC-13]|uniref:SidA/IucD/PvdA family monooxygenase n=2 Tax=Corynebacterium anserum TaxID=2684406 RepID=A0A7G7YRC6_9CORY|nr:NAD(P)-binding domain-containing protein [Corynebacterium anserum]QNH97046.1 SidA/IucD/PvdA family monooxygenase [Corynebacterium anserum]
MELLGHNHDWVPSPGDGVLNVLIIGGGQAGLGAAFALQRHRIDRVKVLEAGPEQYVGCWDRYARMHTLRSPKNMKGIELDIPSLHTRSWFEAKYGKEAWDATELVPRLDWHEYLVWYRTTTGVDVDFNTCVTGVFPPEQEDGDFRVTAEVEGEQVEYRARRVIFALGLDGGGGPFLPDMVKALPRELRAHTEDAIDFSSLAGKRVAVLGGGASGFDNASVALEAGAAEVSVHVRRHEIPTQNSLRWMEFPGMQEHFFDLSDEQKWEFSLFNGGLPQPPTQASVWRAFGFDNFRLVKDSRWADVKVNDAGEIVITDDVGRTTVADFVISATGYSVDLELRPELKEFLPNIALWKDMFEPAKDHPLGKCPYLGDGFQFTPAEGAPQFISRLFHFSTGARASHALAGNQLSGIYAGLTRMSGRIAKDITIENWPGFFEDFQAFEHLEVSNVGRHTEGEGWYPESPRY